MLLSTLPSLALWIPPAYLFLFSHFRQRFCNEQQTIIVKFFSIHSKLLRPRFCRRKVGLGFDLGLMVLASVSRGLFELGLNLGLSSLASFNNTANLYITKHEQNLLVRHWHAITTICRDKNFTLNSEHKNLSFAEAYSPYTYWNSRSDFTTI